MKRRVRRSQAAGASFERTRRACRVVVGRFVEVGLWRWLGIGGLGEGMHTVCVSLEWLRGEIDDTGLDWHSGGSVCCCSRRRPLLAVPLLQGTVGEDRQLT